MTRRKQLLEKVGNENAEATSILAQLGKRARIFPEAMNNDDFLSEFTHPNAMGAHLWFGWRDDEEDARVRPGTSRRAKEALVWTCTELWYSAT